MSGREVGEAMSAEDCKWCWYGWIFAHEHEPMKPTVSDETDLE